MPEPKETHDSNTREIHMLREIKSRYDLVVAGAVDAIWDWDVLNKRVMFSPHWKTLRGYRDDEVDDREDHWFSGIHPEDALRVQNALQGYFTGRLPAYAVEYRVRCKDGSYKWISERGAAQRDDVGRVVRMAGSEIDISEFKRVEEELKNTNAALQNAVLQREAALENLQIYQIELENQNLELRAAHVELETSHALYFDLYDLAPVGYCTLSKKGLIQKANLTAASLLGMQRHNLIEHSFNQFVHPEDLNKYDLYFIQLFKTGGPQAVELRMVKKDTAVFWACLESTVTQDEKGLVVIRVILSNISGRKQFESALRESETRFRTLFEHEAVGVALNDTRTGRYIDINQKFCDFLGYTKKELLDLSFQAVTYPDDLQENIENNALLLAGKTRMFSTEKRYIRKDGSIVWGALTVSPLWDAGEEPSDYYHIAVIKDITEHKWMGEVQTFLAHTSSGTTYKTSFFNVLAEYLGRTLAMDVVCISSLEKDGLAVRTEVIWDGGHFKDNITYTLKDTTCEEVLKQTVCSFPANISKLFPRDRLLHEMKAESFVGVALVGHTAQPIGVISVIGRKPLADPALIEAMLKMVSLRAAGELERLDAEKALREVEIGKREQEMLAKAGEERRILLDNIQTQVWYMTDDHTYGAVNAAHAAFFGMRQEDIAFKNLDDLMSKRAAERVRKVSSRVFATQKPVRSEEWVHNALLGERRLLSITRSPILNADGSVVQVVCSAEDITERNRAEEALRESEWRNRLVSGMTADYVFIVDVDHSGGLKLRWASDNMKRMTGWTVAEVATPDMWKNIIHPDDTHAFFAFIEQILTGIKPGAIECRSFVKSGKERWQEVNAMPQVDESGAVTTIIGSIKDISDRKWAEEALAYERERLEGILVATHAGTWEWNIQTGETILNERWAEMVGYTLEEISPVTMAWITSLIYPDDYQPSTTLLERHMRGDLDYYEYEPRMKHKDGHWVWFLNRGRISSWSADGEPLTMLGTSQNITERKQAELALRESEEKYRILIEESPDPIFSLSPDGRYRFANRALANVYKTSVEDIVGKTMWDFLFKEDADKRFETLSQVFRTGEKKIVEGRVPPDHYYITTITPVKDNQGKVVSVLCSSKDISDRKRAEEKMAAINRQLEESSIRANKLAIQALEATSAKSQFLANMSHEIRTPLNSILGFSQLMQNDPELSTRQKKRVESINRSGEHLLALLNDILELSKIDAGRQSLDATTFDLHALLGDLVVVFRPRAEARQLTFDAVGIEYLPQYITTDELKLRQVLINLLGNAVKFTHTGGIRLRVSAEPDGQGGEEELRLIVLVEDSGQGIAAEEMGRLFEPFEQTLSGRRSGQGTGLGLAISRQFARLMGGEVSVSSEVNKGSVFRLEINVRQGSAPQLAKKADGRQVLRLADGQPACKVLVVEDRDDNRLLMVEMLGAAGFEIQQAKNGVEAVAMFSNWQPQLIFMDHQMPYMNGDEATHQIRHSPGGDQVKIITLTASVTAENRSRTMSAGADDFMTKPFRRSELFEKIHLLTGVQYLYAETEEPAVPNRGPLPVLSKEILAVIPEELRKQVYDAAVRGRQEHLLGLIQQMDDLDADMRKKLQDMVVSFEYEALLQLFI
jgi:PAS domain S-box-containing protein